MLNCELCDATVYGASDSETFSPQVEENASSLRPGFCTNFQIVLRLEISVEHVPFLLVRGTLQDLKLIESGQDYVIIGDERLNGVK